jgi:PRTRC genetic system ThiF family protein
MLSHELHPGIWQHRQPLRTLVVGAGGTGSKVVIGLKNIHQGLVALGFPGLDVVLADGDSVSESNLIRQSFYPSDVGLNKAEVLINRLNLSCGLSWQAYPHEIDRSYGSGYASPKLVIDCVDTRKARATIAEGLERVVYLISSGNLTRTGQVVLGQPRNTYNPPKRDRLRTAYELFPELCDTTIPEDDSPSCSTLEALSRQDLLVNDFASTIILNLLWQLLRHGILNHHGAFFSLKTGSVRPIPIDPKLWRRLQRQYGAAAC